MAIKVKKSKETKFKIAMQNPALIDRERCKRSFYFFFIYFWNEVSSDKLIDNWHIKYICDEVQKIAERVSQRKQKEYDLIINIPPGTSKTTIVSIMFPAWCWVRWYWMKFITAGYSSTLSLEAAEYSRDLIRSQKFQNLFPELGIKKDKDTKSNFRCIKKKFVHRYRQPQEERGGNRFSTSVGGTLTGFHGHINIVDDPLNPQEAISEKQLETANYWIDNTLSTRKTDKETTTMIIIMQRLHQNDPCGHILAKKKKNIRHICLPGELGEYRDLVKPKGLKKHYWRNLLDYNRMGRKVLKELTADLGQYGYAGQIGQNPTPPGGGMFQVDNLITLNACPHNIVEVARYWDKAGSEGTGARTAGVKIAKLDNGRFLVMDVVKGQWASEKREQIIKSTIQADGVNVFQYIEQEPGSGGKESAEATIRNNPGYSIRKDRPTGDKVFRADPFSVQVNEGNVWLLAGEWNRDYIEELRFFPFGTFKDQVDASSGAFAHLTEKKTAGVW